MSAIPCAWCGKPASRMYPGRHIKAPSAATLAKVHGYVYGNLASDCYLCPDCDALVRAGKPLPAGVATFSVAVGGDS